METEIRLPLVPKHCTVLGYRVKSTADPMWAGLYLDLAEIREKASIMALVCGSYEQAPPDRHLRVPWQHPEDREQFGVDTEDCFYRVRCRYKAGDQFRGRAVSDVRFERPEGRWEIVLSTASPGPLP